MLTLRSSRRGAYFGFGTPHAPKMESPDVSIILFYHVAMIRHVPPCTLAEVKGLS